MRKTVTCLIALGCILATGLSAAQPVGLRNLTNQTLFNRFAPMNNVTDLYEDRVDQEQTNISGWVPIGPSTLPGNLVNISVAQSFVPSTRILTRVMLFMNKTQTASQPCTLVIRESLDGEDLTITSVAPEEFPADGNFSWIEFKFFDIPVTPGELYYLVLYTVNVTDNVYFCAGTDGDPYPHGYVFFSFDEGQSWIEETDGDAAFQTYGRDVPEWANGMYYGAWGLSVLGVPALPVGWFTGFSRQKILFGFDGIFGGFDTPVSEASMALSGVVIGPFMLGGIRNLTTEQGAWFVGLGGINATNSLFYYRIMFMAGPNFFMFGKYYPL